MTDKAAYKPAPGELVEAVRNYNAKAVEMFLQCGADVNEEAEDRSALMWAVSGGYTQIADLLINKGADVNQRKPQGSTPLMTAAFRGHTEVAQLLIDRGADIDMTDHAGYTALMMTALADRVETARLLVECGADVNTPEGNQARAIAVSKGYKEIVQLLEEERGRHHAAALKNQRQLNGRAFKPKIIKGLRP